MKPTRADATLARAQAREAKRAAKAAHKTARAARKAAQAERKAARRARRAERSERARSWWSRHLAGHGLTVLIVLVTGVLYSIAWPTLQLTHQAHPALQPVVAAFAALPFLLVRWHPELGWSVSAVAALAIPLGFRPSPGHGIGDALPWQVVHVLVLLALAVAVALQSSTWRTAQVWLGTAALFALFAPGRDRVGWIVGLAGMLAVAMLVRRLWDSRRRLAREEAVSELERTRRTALEERARIARDLHDVVAHHMSLIVVQSQTAPYRVAGLSDDARAEFDSIAGAAREALNEVRVMLGVLRSDEQGAEHEPQPGVAQLRELVDGSARAGVPVRMELLGDADRLGLATAVVLYRIVQESLANATRHAPGAAVRVRVEVGDEVATATVRNDPAPGARGPAGVGGGSGITGMRERAGAVGGALTAGPMPDGGFLVTAELPVLVGIG